MSKKFLLSALTPLASTNADAVITALNAQVAELRDNATALAVKGIDHLSRGEMEAHTNLSQQAADKTLQANKLGDLLYDASRQSDPVMGLPVIDMVAGMELDVDSKTFTTFELYAPKMYEHVLGTAILHAQQGTFLVAIDVNTCPEEVKEGSEMDRLLLGTIIASLQKESATSLRKAGTFSAAAPKRPKPTSSGKAKSTPVKPAASRRAAKTTAKAAAQSKKSEAAAPSSTPSSADAQSPSKRATAGNK